MSNAAERVRAYLDARYQATETDADLGVIDSIRTGVGAKALSEADLEALLQNLDMLTAVLVNHAEHYGTSMPEFG